MVYRPTSGHSTEKEKEKMKLLGFFNLHVFPYNFIIPDSDTLFQGRWDTSKTSPESLSKKPYQAFETLEALICVMQLAGPCYPCIEILPTLIKL